MTDEELDKAALKAIELTNYCTKHSAYHGQKYPDCTPQERTLIKITGVQKEQKI